MGVEHPEPQEMKQW